MGAEVSAASIAGSRRALSRPRLRRLAALSWRSPQPELLAWLRGSVLGRCPGPLIAQDGVEDGEQLAHSGDESETRGFAGRAQTTVRVHRMPAGAARSLTASRTRNHSGYRPGSVSQRSSTNQAMPR